MNVFESVKTAVTARQAAEYYGLTVNKNGMALCPFHHDKNPSMKIDKRYHCFACQADGDVIDFVANYFGISVKDAALKLANDFSVKHDDPHRQNSVKDPPGNRKNQKTLDQFFQEEQNRYFRVYSDYYHLMKRWKVDYAPKIEDDDFHPLFCEAMENYSVIEYKMDILMDGTLEERASLIIDCREEVDRLEQRVKRAIAERYGEGTGNDEEVKGFSLE